MSRDPDASIVFDIRDVPNFARPDAPLVRYWPMRAICSACLPGLPCPECAPAPPAEPRPFLRRLSWRNRP